MSRRKFHGKPCPYCKRQMDLNSYHLQPTNDHIVPKSLGGRKTVICCLKCNNLKGDMLPEAWAAYMAANPDWWKYSRNERKARRLGFPPLPQEHSQFILKYGKKAYREWLAGGCKPAPTRTPVVVPPELIWQRPELIQQTKEQDAKLR